MRMLMLMYAYISISINIEQILARCARSSLTLTRAVQHNHGLLVSCALQGEGMACAPWYVRQRLRRASGRCDSCAALVFSFAPSIRLRG
ncbi:TPA: hypothetical protein ACJFOE_004268 [Escherichia coli]